MCHPFQYDCTPIHFPLLVTSAMDRFGADQVQLGSDAQDALFKHANDHRDAFEAALKPEDPAVLNALAEGLHQRLDTALRKSKQVDGAGREFHPPRISGAALKKALKDHPWLP